MATNHKAFPQKRRTIERRASVLETTLDIVVQELKKLSLKLDDRSQTDDTYLNGRDHSSSNLSPLPPPNQQPPNQPPLLQPPPHQPLSYQPPPPHQPHPYPAPSKYPLQHFQFDEFSDEEFDNPTYQYNDFGDERLVYRRRGRFTNPNSYRRGGFSNPNMEAMAPYLIHGRQGGYSNPDELKILFLTSLDISSP